MSANTAGDRDLVDRRLYIATRLVEDLERHLIADLQLRGRVEFISRLSCVLLDELGDLERP